MTDHKPIAFKWPPEPGADRQADTPFRALHDVCMELLPGEGATKRISLARIFGISGPAYRWYLLNERQVSMSRLTHFVDMWNDGDRPYIELAFTVSVQA